jgi:hypothetical protein
MKSVKFTQADCDYWQVTLILVILPISLFYTKGFAIIYVYCQGKEQVIP